MIANEGQKAARVSAICNSGKPNHCSAANWLSRSIQRWFFSLFFWRGRGEVKSVKNVSRETWQQDRWGYDLGPVLRIPTRHDYSKKLYVKSSIVYTERTILRWFPFQKRYIQKNSCLLVTIYMSYCTCVKFKLEGFGQLLSDGNNKQSNQIQW